MSVSGALMGLQVERAREFLPDGVPAPGAWFPDVSGSSSR